ncbi:MAG: T9SS type A sorting domain-containing protein [Prevotellaceae bacterium]|jgi:hypothetical protein|nr:T9SS type A sorting domain-containing protein [Prevotellaceae bacterium]
MKKVIISMMLSAFALSMNAQEYWIDEDFSSFEAEGDYVKVVDNIETQPNGIELERYYANFETLSGTDASNDGKTEGVFLRVRGFKDAGYAEFTLPADAGVGTIRIVFKAKGTSNDRTAAVLLNGEVDSTFTGLGLESSAVYEKTLNTTDAVTVRIRGNLDTNNDPIIINRIQVSKYTVPEPPTGIATPLSARLAVYFNPQEDVLKVKNTADVEKVDIYNAQGVLLISTKTSGKSEVVIPTATLASGIYIVKAGTETVKIKK